MGREFDRATLAALLLDPNPPALAPIGTDRADMSDAKATARCVLMSLMEPTPAMIAAANKTGNNNVAEKWRAMVGHILDAG
jgi:hypothetical protein